MEILEIKKIWEDVKVELEQTIPPSSYEPWILPLEPIGFENNEFSVLTGQAFAISVIRKNHYSQIIEAFKKIVGQEIEFKMVFDEKLAAKLKKEIQKAKQVAEKSQKETAIDNLAQMQSFSNLNLKYKFENFVVGENNRFAQAAAITVAKTPAKKYNPLFIYGASGVGKTHLMQAIGHYIVFNSPKLKVRYIKTEDFTNELINNIRRGGDINDRMSKFRQKYRNIDVLLLDDIQFIESKERTMEEVFHTFDSLHNNSKQIVITSDRPPKDIPTLPERLRTRFEWGLIVDITPPEFETRVAILANLADEIGMKISLGVLEFIAQNYSKNVRELEGAFNKISAYASIQSIELDVETVKKVLKCDCKAKKIDIEHIAKIVCNHFEVTEKDLKSPARNQKISHARQIAIYLTREITGMSFVSIAEFFNKKHPTILFSYEKIKEEIKVNNDLNDLIENLKIKIKE
ncbi:MAG: chromosomal replication initiator protein DnaA [Candidatus Gastranaerophilales bacterium]|nr:chromosomal replication initiator protein DnaA [Candidatus Gastranaerophilales bacterium]